MWGPSVHNWPPTLQCLEDEAQGEALGEVQFLVSYPAVMRKSYRNNIFAIAIALHSPPPVHDGPDAAPCPGKP